MLPLQIQSGAETKLVKSGQALWPLLYRTFSQLGSGEGSCQGKNQSVQRGEGDAGLGWVRAGERRCPERAGDVPQEPAGKRKTSPKQGEALGGGRTNRSNSRWEKGNPKILAGYFGHISAQRKPLAGARCLSAPVGEAVGASRRLGGSHPQLAPAKGLGFPGPRDGGADGSSGWQRSVLLGIPASLPQIPGDELCPHCLFRQHRAPECLYQHLPQPLPCLWPCSAFSPQKRGRSPQTLSHTAGTRTSSQQLPAQN